MATTGHVIKTITSVGTLTAGSISSTFGAIDIGSSGFTGGTLTLDPDSSSGGAVTISNNATQTSGQLVDITGDSGQTAVRVGTGDVVVSDTLTCGTLTATSLDPGRLAHTRATFAFTSSGSASLEDGTLLGGTAFSAVGSYCIRLTASDVAITDNTTVALPTPVEVATLVLEVENNDGSFSITPQGPASGSLLGTPSATGSNKTGMYVFTCVSGGSSGTWLLVAQGFSA
jgi:hypothetical protein